MSKKVSGKEILVEVFISKCLGILIIDIGLLVAVDYIWDVGFSLLDIGMLSIGWTALWYAWSLVCRYAAEKLYYGKKR